MIPVKTLTTLELNSLSLLDYSLYISADAFRQWTEECNVLYDLTATDSLFTKSLSSTPYTSPPLTPVYFWDNTTAPPFYLDDLVVMSQSMISEPNFVCNPEFLDCDCIIHPEYHPPTLECTSTSWMCQDDSMWYNLF
jgi:hypothetical protein